MRSRRESRAGGAASRRGGSQHSTASSVTAPKTPEGALTVVKEGTESAPEPPVATRDEPTSHALLATPQKSKRSWLDADGDDITVLVRGGCALITVPVHAYRPLIAHTAMCAHGV